MGSISANCICQETGVWRILQSEEERLNSLSGDFPRTKASDCNHISLVDKNLFLSFLFFFSFASD